MSRAYEQRIAIVGLAKALNQLDRVGAASAMVGVDSRELSAFADSLRSAAIEAVEEVAQDALEAAQERSSGTVTSGMLQTLDHPYATRHGEPLLDPGIVNIQTGAFASAWRMARRDSLGQFAAKGDAVMAEIFNEDPKAEKWLEHGTSRMFARPIWDGITERIEDDLAEAFTSRLP